MTESEEKKLAFLESVFEKNGAKPALEDKRNPADTGERTLYLFDGKYFRVGKLTTDDPGEPYIVISSIEDEKYAKVGLLEDIEAVPFSTADADLEKLVRYILGIEPYPEDYYK